jgi:hypothetical protein
MPVPTDAEKAARRLGRLRAIGLLTAIAGLGAIAAEFLVCVRYETALPSPQTPRERFCMGDDLWALLIPTLVFLGGLIVAILAFLQRPDAGPNRP